MTRTLPPSGGRAARRDLRRRACRGARWAPTPPGALQESVMFRVNQVGYIPGGPSERSS